jgi:hypothetical protein
MPLNQKMKATLHWLLPSLMVLCCCLNPFAPKLVQNLESSDLVLTDQRSPDEVLQNFKVAYTFRDSLLYSDLLDTAFLFVYFDPNEGTSGRFVSWERETDLQTTGRLLRYFQIVELVWKTTFYDTVWKDQKTGEISKEFDLTLMTDESSYRLSGRAIFSFRKCADDKWRITRWKDESDI